MSTSVFFTNTYIRVAVGTGGRRSVRVKKACQCDLPEGCMINGLITNQNDLKEAVEQLWTANHLPKKDVHIITNTSRFTMKNVKTPVTKDKKIRRLIVGEFPEVEDGTEMIYDYQQIEREKSSKLCELLAVMAEKEMVDGFVALFKELDIKVASVRPANSSLISMFAVSGMMKNRTCIVQMLEGNDLRSLLYVNGRYTYSSKTRLFSYRGTQDVGTEVARSVSGILQFMTTQSFEEKVDEVLLAGFLPPELEYAGESIDMLGLGLKVAEIQGKHVKMPSDVKFGDYLVPAADLMSDKNSINLIRAVQAQKKAQGTARREVWKQVRPLVILTAGFALVSGVLLFLNARTQAEVDELTAYNTDPRNISDYQEALMYQQEISTLVATLNQVQTFNDTKDSYPWADTKVMDTIISASANLADVEITSYQASTGSLDLQAEAADVTAINRYIDVLEGTGVFESVEYSGYNLFERDGVQRYSINMSCHLTSEAGK